MWEFASQHPGMTLIAFAMLLYVIDHLAEIWLNRNKPVINCECDCDEDEAEEDKEEETK